MLIREHRGGYEESMKTVTEIPATMHAVRKYINSKLTPLGINTDNINIYFYKTDLRNTWETYIVIVIGYGVFGYCNEDVPMDNNNTNININANVFMCDNSGLNN